MPEKHLGRQTVRFDFPPSILSSGSVVGRKEGEGPLGDRFDHVGQDTKFGRETWEQAETAMQQMALEHASKKADIPFSKMDLILGGDLLNQCIGTSFSIRDTGVPFLGLYGACSTMAEGLCLAAMAVEGGFANIAAAVTSSHFASAERQYRLPLEYGGQRTPTAQWTVTGAGALLLGKNDRPPFVRGCTIGRIVDLNIKDANNMGAAMAPAFADTVAAHFQDTGLSPSDYDLIVSGDLGAVGKDLALELLRREGLDLGAVMDDCGLMIYSRQDQDVHAGGSGCGCSAVVLSGYLLELLKAGALRNILFCATGALLSPLTTQQGETIPAISHLVHLRKD